MEFEIKPVADVELLESANRTGKYAALYEAIVALPEGDCILIKPPVDRAKSVTATIYGYCKRRKAQFIISIRKTKDGELAILKTTKKKF